MLIDDQKTETDEEARTTSTIAEVSDEGQIAVVMYSSAENANHDLHCKGIVNINWDRESLIGLPDQPESRENKFKWYCGVFID